MPIDRGEIDRQLKALGEGADWWVHRELRDLPAVLHDNEQILAIGRGRLARQDPLRRSWLVVISDRRLLCLRSAGGSGWRQIEMPAEQITRSAMRLGPFRARILLGGGGSKHRIYVSRAAGYRLYRALSTIISPREKADAAFRPTLIIRRVFDHVLELPTAALNPEATALPRSVSPDIDERVQSLELEVGELRQQVQFLEQLLNEKQEGRGADILQPR